MKKAAAVNIGRDEPLTWTWGSWGGLLKAGLLQEVPRDTFQLTSTPDHLLHPHWCLPCAESRQAWPVGRGGYVSRELGPSKGLAGRKDIGGSLGVEGGKLSSVGARVGFPEVTMPGLCSQDWSRDQVNVSRLGPALSLDWGWESLVLVSQQESLEWAGGLRAQGTGPRGLEDFREEQDFLPWGMGSLGGGKQRNDLVHPGHWQDGHEEPGAQGAEAAGARTAGTEEGGQGAHVRSAWCSQEPRPDSTHKSGWAGPHTAPGRWWQALWQAGLCGCS